MICFRSSVSKTLSRSFSLCSEDLWLNGRPGDYTRLNVFFFTFLRSGESKTDSLSISRYSDEFAINLLSEYLTFGLRTPIEFAIIYSIGRRRPPIGCGEFVVGYFFCGEAGSVCTWSPKIFDILSLSLLSLGLLTPEDF